MTTPASEGKRRKFVTPMSPTGEQSIDDNPPDDSADWAVPKVYFKNDECHLWVPSQFEWMVSKVGEDDPAFAVLFDADKLARFADALTHAPAPVPAAHAVFTSRPFTAESVKNDLMTYMAVNAGGGHQQRAGEIIAPNTLTEFAVIQQRCCHAMLLAGQLPLNLPANTLPLGTAYVLQDRTPNLRPIRSPVVPVVAPAIQLFQ